MAGNKIQNERGLRLDEYMVVKKPSKLIVRLTGGLGNQMFCYAVARRLALVNDAELILDDETGFAYDRKYRRSFGLSPFCLAGRKATNREKLKPFPRLRHKLLKIYSRKIPFQGRPLIFQEQRDFDSRLLSLSFSGTRYFTGVWPSENYFKDIEDLLREDFTLQKMPEDAANRSAAKHIAASNSVAIFVRWFDIPSMDNGNNTPLDYYDRGLKVLESRLDNPYYFIFSDRPDSVRAHLKFPEDRCRVVNHNNSEDMAYADLWLGTQCRHFILSNSTFGWWSAWLGNFPDKIVIAPSTKTVPAANWNIKGFLPDEWITL